MREPRQSYAPLATPPYFPPGFIRWTRGSSASGDLTQAFLLSSSLRFLFLTPLPPLAFAAVCQAPRLCPAHVPSLHPRLLNVGHNPGALVLSGSSSTAGAPSTPTPSPARLAGLQVCPLPTRWMFPHRLNLRLSKKKHLYPCADDALLNSPSLRSISAAQWVILASDRFLSQPAVAPVFFFLSLLCTWGLFHSLQEHLRSARGLTLQGQPSSNDGRESWDKYPIFSVLQFGSCKGGPGVCMGVGAGRSELGTYAGLLLSVSRKPYPDFARSFVMQIFSKTWVQVGPGIHLRCPPFSLGSFLPFQRAGQMGGRCD